MIEKPSYKELEHRVHQLEKTKSERKLIKEHLLDDEAKFRLLTENMNDILWTADLGMNITYLSPSIEKVLGFTVEERLKQSLQEQMPPETLQLTAERLAEELEFDGIRNPKRFSCLEIDYYHKDGSLRCLETSLTFIRNEHGKPVGIHGISRDITDRKQAEKALLESENKYRFITEWITDIVWTMDLDLRTTYVSPSISKMLGFTPEERIQQKAAEIMTTKSYSKVMSDFAREMKKEDLNSARSVKIDAEFYHKDGHTLWMESVVRPILDQDGSITGIHGVSRDITDRKLAEEVLRKSEEKYRYLSKMLRLICDNVPDMIWAKDLEKRFTFANKAICSNLLNAADTDEPIGKTDIFFAERERNRFPDHPDWHSFGEICRDTDTITIEKGVPCHFNEYGNVKGKFLFLSVHKAPFFNEQGKMIGTVGSAQDITERKLAEQALQYSHDKFEAVLNNLDSIVYIADMKSYEILFCNAYMKKEVGKDFTGRTCWKCIHENQTGPCEFCTNDRLIDGDGNPTGLYIWEFYHKKMNKWYECHDQAIFWTDGRLVRMEKAYDITEKKKMKNHLEELVEKRTAELKDTNTALTILLNKRVKDQENIEGKILANYQSLIEPLLNRLKKNTANKNQHNLLEILESNLASMLSPFSQKLTDPMIQLTPKELQIASFIKQDYSNKEIAETFNCSVRTIDTHRNNIRNKLDIKNKKVNLKTYLMTFH